MNRWHLLLGVVARMVVHPVLAQDPTFTAQFPIEDCHFSPFGGHPHFILDPGHQLVLRGEEDGEQKELVITSLNETKEITLEAGNVSRRIPTRVVEEREYTNGDLTEIARYWYARCLETGDIYYFGEESETYDHGVLISQARLWEAGVDGATPGIIMPRTFLLGARYLQDHAPGRSMDQAENLAVNVTVSTPAGTFEDCVQIRETDGLRPELPPSIKSYAPGVGVVQDNVFLLHEFSLGKIEGLPRDCRFAPFSDNRFLPFAPGRQWILEDQAVGEQVRLTRTVLDQIREITLPVAGEPQTIGARVIEDRTTVNAQLVRVVRQLLAQCHETGDVYRFGQEVDLFEDGVIVGHEGSWLAGTDAAQPTMVMPGHFTVGAQYYVERTPGVATNLARNSAKDLTRSVPLGTFAGCVSVTETDPLAPGNPARIKTYAPAVGLINDNELLKLSGFLDPNLAAGSPVLSAQDAVLLSWPLTDAAYRVETSADLQTWVPLPQMPVLFDGHHLLAAPRSTTLKYYRLVSP